MFMRGVENRSESRRNFRQSPVFNAKFAQLLQQRAARKKNTPGIDRARGIGQALAAVKGRNNTRKVGPAGIEPSIDPVAAALQNTVRNRSVEQGGNAPTRVYSAGAPVNEGDRATNTILGMLKARGLI